MFKRNLILAVIVSFFLGAQSVQAQDDKLKDVEANNITLSVPADWEEIETTSSMRAAQVQVPAAEEGGEPADLIVYYFGGGATGGVKANLDRWLGQFHEDGREFELSKGKCRDGHFVLIDISGTWKKPVGPPAAGRSEDKPDSRVIGVILVNEEDDGEEYYFLKFSGDDKLVKSNEKQLRKSFGVDSDSEKPIKLEDVDN